MKHSKGNVSCSARWKVALFFSLITFLFLFPVSDANAYVELDPDFGVGGVASLDISDGDDTVNSLFIDDQGRIILAGSAGFFTNADFAIARFNSDGNIDDTFGSGGYVTADLSGNADYAQGCAMDSTGNIVVAGMFDNSGTGYDFGLAIFDTEGNLEKVVSKDFNARNDRAYACLIDGDDNVIMAGRATIANAEADFALVGYDMADEIMGSELYDGWANEQAHAVAMDSQGRIVMAGEAARSYSLTADPYNFALMRIDMNFDPDFIVSTDFYGKSDNAYAVAVDSDDRIVVAGSSWVNSSNKNFALARYNTDGSLDPTFGTGGKVTTHVGSLNDFARTCVIDSQGRIIVAGVTGNDDASKDLVIARYNSDGTPDTDFTPEGFLVTDISNDEGANACMVDEQGRIVVAGYSNGPGSDRRFILLRFLTDDSSVPVGDDDDDFVPPVTDDDDDEIISDPEDDQTTLDGSGCSLAGFTGTFLVLMLPLLYLFRKK